MKALIFSDSHGDINGMINAIEENPDVSQIIFAGDVQRDIDDISSIYDKIPCAFVLGNNDFYTQGVPFERVFEFCGKRIFLTHGHRYSVKLSPRRVISEAKKAHADICIFGHTHQKFLEHSDIWAVNPGSARYSYAVLTVKNNDINIYISEI